MKAIILRNNWQYILTALVVVALMGAIAWGVQANNHVRNNATIVDRNKDTAVTAEEHGIIPLNTAQASNDQSTADQLTYLVEEEKLAHDVYLKMFELWGARIFTHISDSEATHQSLVWSVMESRGLTDPRNDEMGVFANQELQAFYDRLIAQGSQSQVEAYKVGVIIEETDIADLKEGIAALKDQDSDAKDVLDMLLHGSENHLRAFNRQLDR